MDEMNTLAAFKAKIVTFQSYRFGIFMTVIGVSVSYNTIYKFIILDT